VRRISRNDFWQTEGLIRKHAVELGTEQTQRRGERGEAQRIAFRMRAPNGALAVARVTLRFSAAFAPLRFSRSFSSAFVRLIYKRKLIRLQQGVRIGLPSSQGWAAIRCGPIRAGRGLTFNAALFLQLLPVERTIRGQGGGGAD
jgi:hypothetical protein